MAFKSQVKLLEPEQCHVKAWSLSALGQYEACPLAYKLARFDKIPGKGASPALEYGIKVHKMMEDFLNSVITEIPKELSKLETEITNLLKHNAVAEEELVVDNHWQPIKGVERPWFASNAWLRGKTDARVCNLVIDLKSGKEYDGYEQAAELYSILTMKLNPEFTEVDVEFWYSKTGNVKGYTYHRSDINDMIAVWDTRVSKLFREKHWLPKEHQYCKWCDYQYMCPLFT